MTQTDRLLAYLQKWGRITAWEAMHENDVRIYRLSARILELRKRGYRITARRIPLPGGKLGPWEYRLEPTNPLRDRVEAENMALLGERLLQRRLVEIHP